MKYKMLYFLIAFTIIFFSCTSLNAQLLTEEEHKKLIQAASDNWEISILEDQIIITSTTLYWFYNAVSLPYMEGEEFIRYVKNSGRQDYYEITLIFVEKWTKEKLEEAEKHNQAIQEELHRLPEKHGVAHLYPNKMGSFIPESEEDEEKIKKYDEEYEILKAQLIEIPDHHSSKYSIFFRDNRYGYEGVWGEEELINDKLQEIFSNTISS